MGCIFGFILGGWISQNVGKQNILIASNFCTFLIWVTLSFQLVTVEFIILCRFLMGLFSAAANGCVGSVRKGKKWRCHEHNIFINTFIFYKAHTYQRQSIQN